MRRYCGSLDESLADDEVVCGNLTVAIKEVYAYGLMDIYAFHHIRFRHRILTSVGNVTIMSVTSIDIETLYHNRN